MGKMATPPLTDEQVYGPDQETGLPRPIDERQIEKQQAVGDQRMSRRARDELWQPRYLALALIIVVLIALQLWVLF